MTKTLIGTPDPDEPEDPFGEGSHAFTGLTRAFPLCSTQGHVMAVSMLRITAAAGFVNGVCINCNEPISMRYLGVAVDLT